MFTIGIGFHVSYIRIVHMYLEKLLTGIYDSVLCYELFKTSYLLLLSC